MLLGTYEQACMPWSPRRRRPGTSATNCCSPTSTASRRRSRSASSISRPSRTPASSKIINGPFTFAPDGNPLVGPVRGLRNFWVACGVMAGFSQGGGVGLALSNWMVDGDPGLRRLGDGRRPLRRLGDAGLHQRQGARELFAPLPHPLPQRGAAGGAAAAHDADLRPAAGARTRCSATTFGLEHAALVRARRRRGRRGHHLPPLQRLRACRRASAARCASGVGPAGDLRATPSTRSPATGAEAWLVAAAWPTRAAARAASRSRRC